MSNMPKSVIALIFAHEMIHAEMYRKMLDALKDAKINEKTLQWDEWKDPKGFKKFLNSMENKYDGIFDYFVRYKHNIPRNEKSEWQHQMMAQHYRNIIKDVLTEYDEINTEITLTEEQKEALSWIGLMNDKFPSWNKLSQDEQEKIEGIQSDIKKNYKNGCNE